MRIVTLTDSMFCPTGFGTQHRLMAEGLALSGHEVFALNLFDGNPLRRSTGGFWTMGMGPGGFADLYRQWGELYRMFKPDWVFTFADLHLCDGLTREPDKWHKRGEFKWVNWYPVDNPSFEWTRLGQLGVMDFCVFLSNFGRDVVMPHMPNLPHRTIYPGVDTTIFHPVDAAAKARLRDEIGTELHTDLDGKFLLVSTDTNSWRKATYVILQAMAKLPKNVVALLHCSPEARPGSDGWNLTALRKQLGLEGRVFFTGTAATRPHLSRLRLAQLYQAADLRVFPTQGEGFGVGTIEAGACGLPSVLTDCTTSPEAAPFEECLAPVAHWSVQQENLAARAHVDLDCLVGRIIYLLGHEERRAEIGAAMRQDVMMRFDERNIINQWRDVAMELLGDGHVLDEPRVVLQGACEPDPPPGDIAEAPARGAGGKHRSRPKRDRSEGE